MSAFNLITADDLRKHALKQSGELIDQTSDYDILSDDENGIKDLDLMNQVYRTLHYGGTELNVSLSEVFPWLKADDPEILTLIPPFETGTISLINGSTSGTLSTAPTGLGSFADYFLKIEGRRTIYRISAHTANATAITLDQAYLEATGSTLTFKIIKLDYTLTNKMARIFKELRTEKRQFDADETGQIKYLTEDTFDQHYPRLRLTSGTPTAFTIIQDDDDIKTIRFNRYPKEDKIRVEVPYIPQPKQMIVLSCLPAAISSNIFTIPHHQLVANRPIRFSSTGTLPTPLTRDTNYFVLFLSADTFRISTAEGGSVLSITDPGSGNHFISTIPKMPHGYRPLLSDYATYRIMLDKSDPRSDSYLRSAQAMLQSMVHEARRTARKAGKDRGYLMPRLDQNPPNRRIRYFNDGT